MKNINSYKGYKMAIVSIETLKTQAGNKYNEIMDQYDYLLDDENWTEENEALWIEKEIKAQEETAYNVYMNKLSKLEDEFINYCKENFIKENLMNEDLKYLFEKASKNIVIHDKLIKKLMLLN